VSIAAEQEREFYDRTYAQHLRADDGALAFNRQVLLRELADPASAMYERRLLYQSALQALLSQQLQDARALDYGCGGGEWGVLLATEGAEVTLLDLSPVAIELGLRRARASGVADRVRGYARDASDLSCFSNGEFDLVFACAALHHTMKYPNALRELVRVLKPGGRLVLAEGWGNNPLLDFARRTRWRLSGQPDEAGEGLIFCERDVRLLEQHLRRVEIYPVNLLAMTKRLFRGRFTWPPVRAALRLLETLDRSLLAAMPSLKRYCGEVVVVAEK
jgi:SAM-dependent methyltransferase